MAIHDLPSKRLEREAKAGKPEVWVYDVVPPRLRGQIFHSLSILFGLDKYNHKWTIIYDILIREYGLFHLPGKIVIDGYIDHKKQYEISSCITGHGILH